MAHGVCISLWTKHARHSGDHHLFCARLFLFFACKHFWATSADCVSTLLSSFSSWLGMCITSVPSFFFCIMCIYLRPSMLSHSLLLSVCSALFLLALAPHTLCNFRGLLTDTSTTHSLLYLLSSPRSPDRRFIMSLDIDSHRVVIIAILLRTLGSSLDVSNSSRILVEMKRGG